MLAVVTDYDGVAAALPRLADTSWIVAPEPGDEAARTYSICHPTIQRRTHHLHVVEPSWGWHDLLRYRDYLRADPSVATEYAALKRRLAAADADDRRRYRAAKAARRRHRQRSAAISSTHPARNAAVDHQVRGAAIAPEPANRRQFLDSVELLFH